ncbi:MAG: hypothetical protein MOGMAGMI_01573 [Candidatus Omnitrophica bacterium]|nr:hypothetical protein [Candidatus Omnitrophota bacterium]
MPKSPISPFDFLAHVPELSSLPRPELNYLVSKSALIEIKPKQILFSQGEPSQYFYVVIEGRVSMGDCGSSGRETVSCIAGRRDIFCCLPALDHKPYPATAVSATDAKALRIPIAVLQEIGSRNPSVYQMFVAKVCANLRVIEQRHSQRMEPAVTRISSLLIDQYEKTPHPIRLTRAEIAKLTGTTVETAIRTLSQLGKRGILQSRRGLIKVVEAKKLYELAGRMAPEA